MFTALVLALALSSPAQLPRRPIADHASPWVNVPSVTVAAGATATSSVTFPSIPSDATNVRLQYKIDMTNPATGIPAPALNYAVENLSLANACPGYDGSYGASFMLRVGPQAVDGIGFHVGMCGGVYLTKFDGAADFSGPNGIPYGGSGHNFGTGFPVYEYEAPMPSWFPYMNLPLNVEVTPFCMFSSWNGDTNWIRSAWIDGTKYRVLARLVWQ